MNSSVIDYSRRRPESGVAKQFWQRWSPRAYQAFAIPGADLRTIFDAARWSPSANNEQPWRFYSAGCDSNRFSAFLELLNDSNRVWAQAASVVGFLLSRTRFEHNGQVNPWARFDCGAAWMALSLQANALGYHSHAMAGIKLEVICQALHADPAEYEPICGFVIGKRADPAVLPPALQKREVPSQRKELDEIWFPG